MCSKSMAGDWMAWLIQTHKHMDIYKVRIQLVFVHVHSILYSICNFNALIQNAVHTVLCAIHMQSYAELLLNDR